EWNRRRKPAACSVWLGALDRTPTAAVKRQTEVLAEQKCKNGLGSRQDSDRVDADEAVLSPPRKGASARCCSSAPRCGGSVSSSDGAPHLIPTPPAPRVADRRLLTRFPHPRPFFHRP